MLLYKFSSFAFYIFICYLHVELTNSCTLGSCSQSGCIIVQGYTIPLDKRLAADGRGLQSVHINENFAKLAEALYIADRKVSTGVSH